MAAVVSLRVVVGGGREGAIVGQRPGGIKKKFCSVEIDRCNSSVLEKLLCNFPCCLENTVGEAAGSNSNAAKL